jgi:hypothetical protein
MTDPDSPTIHQLLATAASEVGAIGKNKRMEAGPAKYAYRSVDDVIAAVHPVFAKLGIVMAPRVTRMEYGEMSTKSGGSLRLVTMEVNFYFYGPKGDCVTVTTMGEATDSGDKAPNKAHTAALKVALCQLLLIPFDSQDPDETRQEFDPPPRQERPKSPAEPATPETCTECGAEFQQGEKKQGRRSAFKHLTCPETVAPSQPLPQPDPAEQVQAAFEGAEFVDANGVPVSNDPF